MSRRRSGFPSLPTSRFVVTDCLGEGAFASIYRATDKVTKQEVAIKMIKKKSSVPSLSEYLIGRMLNHPNIVATLDCIDSRDCSYVVLELANGGDLFGRLDPRSDGLDEATARKFSLQLAESIAYMHSRNIVHSDIKPENVLIHNDNVQLCDFGLAGYVKTEKNGPAMGTGAYMAPELMTKKSKKSIYSLQKEQDVWSMGIVLYAILFADLPWEKARESDPDFALFQAEGGVSRSLYPFNMLSRPMRALLARMLAINPADRCSMKEVVEFLTTSVPWFSPKTGSPKTDRRERIAPEVLHGKFSEEEEEEEEHCMVKVPVVRNDCGSTISLNSVSTASLVSIRTPSFGEDSEMTNRIGSLVVS